MVGRSMDVRRKLGRPRAIPEEMEGVVVHLYQLGLGYRAIARILRTEHGLNPDFTTVRRVLLRLGKVKNRELGPEGRS